MTESRIHHSIPPIEKLELSNLFTFIVNDPINAIDYLGLIMTDDGMANRGEYGNPKPPCDDCASSGGHYEPYWQIMGYASPFQCATAQWDLNRDTLLGVIGGIIGGRIGGGEGSVVGAGIGTALIPNAICNLQICVH
jgi:hypothetical protein